MHKKICGCMIATMLLGGLLTGCGNDDDYLSQDKAAQMIEQDKSVLVLDVRTAEEYEAGHIPEATLLPIDDLRAGKTECLPDDKGRTVLVYCWTGRRAEDAVAILKKLGYRKVYNFGGIVDWEGPLTGSKKSPQEVKEMRTGSQ